MVGVAIFYSALIKNRTFFAIIFLIAYSIFTQSQILTHQNYRLAQL